MFVCTGEDSTGHVRIIGFNDVVDTIGSQLIEGKTYEFQGIVPSPDQRNNDALVVKINQRTNIQMVTPMNFELEPHIDFGALESCTVPIVKGVAVSVDGRRVVLQNHSGELLIHVKERHAPSDGIEIGKVVAVRVIRVGKRNWFSVLPLEYVTDVTMTTWFEDCGQTFKRQKPNDVRIADIPSLEYGDRIQLTAIVTKCGLSNTPTQRGVQVMRITVGDSSGKCVDVSVFNDTQHPSIEIGKPLSFVASVSNFGVYSLIAKEFEPNPRAETAIETWWSTNQTSALENVNNVYSTPANVQNNDNRFNLIGFVVPDGDTIRDETTTIPLIYSNVTDKLNGVVIIRNCKKNSMGEITIYNDTCIQQADGVEADRLRAYFV